MHFRTLLILTATLGVTCAFPVSAHADQPLMRRAIDLLQKAKTVKRPVPLLEKALENVKNARKNKGGRRFDAMPAIREAIKVAKDGGDPESKINHAIAMIHSGMGRAN